MTLHDDEEGGSTTIGELINKGHLVAHGDDHAIDTLHNKGGTFISRASKYSKAPKAIPATTFAPTRKPKAPKPAVAEPVQ